MNRPFTNGKDLTPEELQRQLEEALRQLGIKDSPFFKKSGGGNSSPESASQESGTPSPKRKRPAMDDLLKFNRKPREVKEYLDRYVIRQDEAKKVLSVALCDHYNHVRLAREGKTRASHNYSKQNVILLGPTGVGKTYLVRSMADLIGVPFVKADATKFSETGYVGADVEELVRNLVRQANGDVERAQYGIIYIDEIDKIASASASQGGRDVSGRGVQTNLLKLMEETEVPTRAPNDLSGQFEMMMRMGGDKKPQPATINTRHILFIVSGAFDGLEKIVSKRLREDSIGFSASRGPKGNVRTEDVFDQATTRDFIDFGFEPEFIGRLPVRVVCKPLDEDDLYEILKSSEGSIVRQYEQSFGAYKIEVFFEDEALREIARLAALEKTGARGLMTVCEKVFRQYKFELPSTNLSRFVVTRKTILDPEKELALLLQEGQKEHFKVSSAVVHEFAERFTQSYGIRLRFTDGAAISLAQSAEEQKMPVRDYCAQVFKDYQFGLKLVMSNHGDEEFLLDEEAVKNPDDWLSARVVKTYRNPPDEPDEEK